MTRALLAILLCMTLAAAKTPQKTVVETKTLDCAPVGTMAKKLMQEKKLSYLADAIDTKDLVHMWYVNKQTGRWAELEVTDDLNACIVREGYDWHFAAGG